MPSVGFYQVEISCVALQHEIPGQNLIILSTKKLFQLGYPVKHSGYPLDWTLIVETAGNFSA